MTKLLPLYSRIADRETGEEGVIIHHFRGDPSIVGVRFFGDRVDLAVPSESLRRVKRKARRARR
jgi:hypothetical protein